MKLRITEEIQKLVSGDLHNIELTSEEISSKWIDHSAAIKLSKTCGVSLTRLLHGSCVVIEQQVPTAKTAEYLQLMKDLRSKQQEYEYKKLIADQNPDIKQTIDFKISKDVQDQLTVILNVLISIAAVTWAFWYWCSSWDLGARVLMSLGAGAITGAAEVTVFVRYLRNTHKSNADFKKNTMGTSTHDNHILKRIIFEKGAESVYHDKVEHYETTVDNNNTPFQNLHQEKQADAGLSSNTRDLNAPRHRFTKTQ
ncbi:hypothetical protein DASB73_042470 [Starmerella bacillaris]|uniref:Calcium uniporter protein n=1 Tax=Starmerella bacillaris TaxID=1247836 RepID=A0AAV5RRX4_STABA|nr:hypothetical protein DASB73_042470 [Starmerella bacillaris]